MADIEHYQKIHGLDRKAVLAETDPMELMRWAGRVSWVMVGHKSDENELIALESHVYFIHARVEDLINPNAIEDYLSGKEKVREQETVSYFREVHGVDLSKQYQQYQDEIEEARRNPPDLPDPKLAIKKLLYATSPLGYERNLKRYEESKRRR